VRISLVAAMAENRVIGADNRLPWDLPADLKRFRSLTSGHPIVMGRKTFESIGRVLPNRTNIVVTRNPGYRVLGAQVVASLDAAFEVARGAPGAKGPEGECFVIGGAEIYVLALPLADRLYITEVHRAFAGDAYFPEWPAHRFREAERERHEDPSGTAFSFVRLERQPAS
jgi:dihydrofolate reductase